MSKGIDDDEQYYVKNLDTGETADLAEAGRKFHVMALDSRSEKEEEDSLQQFTDDEDYYFDAMVEVLKMELADRSQSTLQVPEGGRLHFLRVAGHEIVSDREGRKFCVFVLEVQCNTASPPQWKVYRRYNQFRKLNDKLRSEGYYVPVMPPKNIMGGMLPDVISKRKVDLEAWLRHLMVQHSIDSAAKDPQSNRFYRNFLLEDANCPPFRESLSDKADSKEDDYREKESKLSQASQKPKVCVDDFALIKVIGKGSFGKVTLVRKISDSKLYAMKVLSKPNIVRRKQVEHTRTERRVLGTINHPNIVKLHYAFQTKEKLYFVLDYAAGGELFFHLSRMKKFPEHFARFYSAQIASALDALHKIGVVYRDLKPENILLDSEGHIKLADFGLAKENVNEAASGATSLCGTPEYLSPEVLDRQGHGTAVDWWNLGMVTYEMLTGLPPWYTTDKQKLFDRLRNAPLKFPYYVSKPAASFIHGLLQRNPEVRLGSQGGEEVRQHRFFSDIDWVALMNRDIAPPFDPCRQHDGDADTDNFEKEFTQMPINSVETASASRQALLAEGLSNSSSSETFSNFTYQEDTYLDSCSLTSSDMTISPPPSPRREEK